MHATNETIVAIASAPGGSLEGIVRASGDELLEVLTQVFSPPEALRQTQQPQAVEGVLDLTPPMGNVPCTLYLWPTRRSYTRQPTAELYLPGSPPILQAAVQRLCESGARPAEPGEFTLRAFLSGRLDLTQAEAVLGVIDASDRSELDSALTQLAGGMAGPLTQLRQELLELLSHIEAGLDFVDEDIEFISRDDLLAQLGQAEHLVSTLAEQLAARGRVGDENRVVLVGRPNAGKSSLMNALAGEHAALVSPQQGTTRDYVQRAVEIDGLRCLLTDTAGVQHEGQQTIGQAAQQLTQQQTQAAQLELLCIDASQELTTWDAEQLSGDGHNRVIVMTKCDLPRKTTLTYAVETSAATGAGLDALGAEIHRHLSRSHIHDDGHITATAVRCHAQLAQAGQDLARAKQTALDRLGDELVAEDLRRALDAIGRVVGAVYTDDILDQIFGRFCIGK